MRARTVIFSLMLFLPLIPLAMDGSDGSDTNEPFSLKLTDSEGNDLSDPLFGDVTIFFDTINTHNLTIFKLKAMLAIKTIPAYLKVTSTGGLFKMTVSAEGAGSFLDDTGMRITITDSTNTFTADLTKNGGYLAEFKNGANVAALDPNVNYSVSANLINEYNSQVTPESVNNIKFTFQAIASEGFHQVIFMSQDDVVESYVAFDNYVINEVPSVSRSGYTFKGWFTPDGKEVTAGQVITSDDGDIIAIAKWEENENNIIVYIGVGGGVSAAAVLLLLLLKRRKSDDS